LFVNTLLEERKKGFNTKDSVSDSLERFNILKGMPSRLRKGILLKSRACELVSLAFRKEITYSDCLNQFWLTHKKPMPFITEEVGRNFFSEIAVRLFAKSTDPDTPGSLGFLAENLVLFLTSLPLDPIQSTLSHPILYCYGMIEEMSVKLMRKALYIDTTTDEE